MKCSITLCQGKCCTVSKDKGIWLQGDITDSFCSNFKWASNRLTEIDSFLKKSISGGKLLSTSSLCAIALTFS